MDMGLKGGENHDTSWLLRVVNDRCVVCALDRDVVVRGVFVFMHRVWPYSSFRFF